MDKSGSHSNVKAFSGAGRTLGGVATGGGVASTGGEGDDSLDAATIDRVSVNSVSIVC